MRIKISKKAWCVCITLGSLTLTNQVAWGSSVPELQAFFAQQVRQVPQAVLACQMDDQASVAGFGEVNEVCDFNSFFLNVNPYISIGIPTLLQVTVSPEIEFIWEKSE